MAAQLVVDNDGTDGIGFEFAADNRGGDAALLEVGQEVDV